MGVHDGRPSLRARADRCCTTLSWREMSSVFFCVCVHIAAAVVVLCVFVSSLLFDLNFLGDKTLLLRGMGGRLV